MKTTNTIRRMKAANRVGKLSSDAKKRLSCAKSLQKIGYKVVYLCEQKEEVIEAVKAAAEIEWEKQTLRNLHMTV